MRSLQNGKRSKRKRADTTMVAGPVTNIGDRARTKLRYVDWKALSTASTGYAENIYRLNSCFDPDFSGAGSQPLGFDQWAAFYTRYKVLSAKWRVDFFSPTSLAESIVSVTPNLVNTIDNVGTNILAEPYSEFSAFSTNGGWKPRVAGSVALEKMFGVTKEEYGEENYTALTSASPASAAYLHIRVDTASGGLSGSVYYLLNMEYEVEFYARVELELSLWKEFELFKKNLRTSEPQSSQPVVPSQYQLPASSNNDDKDVKVLLARLLNK